MKLAFETGGVSFVASVEDFVNNILKLIKAFFALFGIDFSAKNKD